VNRFEEGVLLAGCQISPGAERQTGDTEGTDADTAQALDRDADRVHHVSHEVVRALVDHQLEDETVGRLPQDPELLRHGAVPRDDDAVAHPLQHGLGRTRERQDVVLLVEFVAGVHDPIGDVAVVGEEEEPFGVAIESTDRIDPFRNLNDVHDGAPVSFVFRRRDVAPRLVQNQVARALRAQQFAIDPDLGVHGVDFRAQRGHDLAVDAHPTGSDQRFRGASRGDAARGEDPLQPFHGKSRSPTASGRLPIRRWRRTAPGSRDGRLIDRQLGDLLRTDEE
jgi:hypothetical protein